MSHLTERVKKIGAREKGEWEGGGAVGGEGVSALQSPQGSPFPCCRPSMGTALLCNFISMAGIISHCNYF